MQQQQQAIVKMICTPDFLYDFIKQDHLGHFNLDIVSVKTIENELFDVTLKGKNISCKLYNKYVILHVDKKESKEYKVTNEFSPPLVTYRLRMTEDINQNIISEKNSKSDDEFRSLLKKFLEIVEKEEKDERV